jgi:hypothetical protein
MGHYHNFKLAPQLRPISVGKDAWIEICCDRLSLELHLCSRFDIFTAVTTNSAVFWDVDPCISRVNRRFRGTIAFIFRTADYNHLLKLIPRSRIIHWRWKRYVPPKRRFTQDLHDATSQKTACLYLCFLQRWILVDCVTVWTTPATTWGMCRVCVILDYPDYTLAQHLDLPSWFRDFITVERELCNFTTNDCAIFVYTFNITSATCKLKEMC